jgi:hypothetical protein
MDYFLRLISSLSFQSWIIEGGVKAAAVEEAVAWP